MFAVNHRILLIVEVAGIPGSRGELRRLQCRGTLKYSNLATVQKLDEMGPSQKPDGLFMISVSNFFTHGGLNRKPHRQKALSILSAGIDLSTYPISGR
jgi:hypothetical protein